MYSFNRIQAEFVNYENSTFVYPSAESVEFQVRDYCLGASWLRPEGFVQVVNQDSNSIQSIENPDSHFITQAVLQEPTTVIINLHNYILPYNEPTFESDTDNCGVKTDEVYANCCGSSLFKFNWVRGETAINQELFTSPTQNDEEAGFLPAIFQLVSYDNIDVGSYTYTFTLRVSALSDYPEVIQEELNAYVSISDCSTIETSATNNIGNLRLNLDSTVWEKVSWSDFSQEP